MSLLIRSWQQSLKSAALCNRMSVSLGSGTEVAGSLVCFGYYVQMNSMNSFQKSVVLCVITEHFLVDGIRCFMRQLRKGKHGATGYSQDFFYLRWKLYRGFIVYNYSQEYMQKYKLFYDHVDLSLSCCLLGAPQPCLSSLHSPLYVFCTFFCQMSIWKAPLAYPSSPYSTVIFLPVATLFHSLPLKVPIFFFPFSDSAQLTSRITYTLLGCWSHVELAFDLHYQKEASLQRLYLFCPLPYAMCVEQCISLRHAQYCVKIYKSDRGWGIKFQDEAIALLGNSPSQEQMQPRELRLQRRGLHIESHGHINGCSGFLGLMRKQNNSRNVQLKHHEINCLNNTNLSGHNSGGQKSRWS